MNLSSFKKISETIYSFRKNVRFFVRFLYLINGKNENLFHAETVKLLKLFTGNHRILVPDFQRKYDWELYKSGEVTTFLEDIMDAKNSDYIDTYYLGPIITYQEDEDSNSID